MGKRNNVQYFRYLFFLGEVSINGGTCVDELLSDSDISNSSQLLFETLDCSIQRITQLGDVYVKCFYIIGTNWKIKKICDSNAHNVWRRHVTVISDEFDNTYQIDQFMLITVHISIGSSRFGIQMAHSYCNFYLLKHSSVHYSIFVNLVIN